MLLKNQPGISSHAVLVAVNPDAAWEIQKRGIEYVTLDDYQTFPPTEKMESLLDGQIRWAQNVDNFLRENIPCFEDTDFNPAQNYLLQLKNSWDTFIQRAEILDLLSSELNPKEIIFFKNANTGIQYDENLVPQGSVLTECIPSWADYHDVIQRPLPTLPKDLFWRRQSDMRFSLRALLGRSVKHFPHCVSQKIINMYWMVKKPSFPQQLLSENPPTIAIQYLYDINIDLVTALHKKGINTRPYEDFFIGAIPDDGDIRLIRQHLDESWINLQSQKWFWSPQGDQKWSLKNCLGPLLRRFWVTTIPELWKKRTHAAKILTKEKPVALIYGTIYSANEIGLVMAAQSSDIPIICYQHGASMGDIENPLWDILDQYYSRYMLVYGMGECDYVNTRPNHGNPKAQPIPVGSARLDRIARHLCHDKAALTRKKCVGTSDKPVILYVPGIYFNNFYRYTYNVINAPFYRVRNRVAEYFSCKNNLHFLYKAFVSSGVDPTLSIYNEIFPNCQIINNIPLSELQWSVDLIIHEFPSTGMYEGLVTDKPMIVYADSNVYRLHKNARDLLKRRVILAENEDGFIASIRQFVENNDYSLIKNPDRGFLKEFCTYSDDGLSASRSADAIASILNIKA